MMNKKQNPEAADICYVKGIGEKRAKTLSKLGINTAYDLATYFPSGHIDFTDITTIANAPSNEYVVIKAIISRKLAPYRGRISVFKAVAFDESNRDVLITFFNSEYSFQRLEVDKEFCFYGKITGDFLRREMNSPIFIDADSPDVMQPKYRLTEGISNNILSKCIRNALNSFDYPDRLPAEIREKYGLIPFSEALEKIHFPHSKKEYNDAKRRLTFEELLVLQLGMRLMKQHNRAKTGAVMENRSIDDFYRSLPFTLTSSQMTAIAECIADMQKSTPMNRLLQGDVGSGKTAVAAGICYFAYLNGSQSALMAPTEILAKQHYDTLCSFLSPLGVKVMLITGGSSASEKKKAREAVSNGEADVIVGTQALIQKNTVFKKLGLVITDEQHRFGVYQRAALSEKGENPHILVMSATPIPRTLAMIIYGDLDISVLSEMPKGRLPIETYGVNSSFHGRLYKFILKHINEGRQAYIVCPLVEEGVSEKASATAYIEKLKDTCLKDIPVGLLHGKMKQSEKDIVMQAFKNNEIKLLVSTTVIEVGVDVPNATVMLIENAEQFGLSQLHQLRGRVGRGDKQSYCVLITDNESEYTKQRIKTMVNSTDGFEIANTDLKLRGPGNFFGAQQHGLPQLKIADIYAEPETIEITKKAAEEILRDDPRLSSIQNNGLKLLTERLFSGLHNT